MVTFPFVTWEELLHGKITTTLGDSTISVYMQKSDTTDVKRSGLLVQRKGDSDIGWGTKHLY